MICVIGGVIGEGKVGGKELNVRNNDGRMLRTDKWRTTPQGTVGEDIPFKSARPCTLRVGAIPVIS